MWQRWPSERHQFVERVCQHELFAEKGPQINARRVSDRKRSRKAIRLQSVQRTRLVERLDLPRTSRRIQSPSSLVLCQSFHLKSASSHHSKKSRQLRDSHPMRKLWRTWAPVRRHHQDFSAIRQREKQIHESTRRRSNRSRCRCLEQAPSLIIVGRNNQAVGLLPRKAHD